MKTFFKSKNFRRCEIAIGIFVLVYVSVYSGLSMAGRYQPNAVGFDHVEAYAWAPFGFYDPGHAWRGSGYATRHPTEKTGGWHDYMLLAFGPLWELDCRFIHKEPAGLPLELPRIPNLTSP